VSDVFGRIIGADDVREALVDHIKTWSPTYLAEVSRQAGLPAGTLPTFRQYQEMVDFAELGEHQSPACVVTPSGMDDAEEYADGDGGYLDGRWTATAYVFVVGTDHDTVARLVARYCKALRALLRQQPIRGLQATVRIVGEAYNELPGSDVSDRRFRGGGAVVCTVDVEGVNALTAAISAPDLDPAPPDTVVTTSATFDQEP
jgi:hypothetical protein